MGGVQNIYSKNYTLALASVGISFRIRMVSSIKHVVHTHTRVRNSMGTNFLKEIA